MIIPIRFNAAGHLRMTSGRESKINGPELGRDADVSPESRVVVGVMSISYLPGRLMVTFGAAGFVFAVTSAPAHAAGLFDYLFGGFSSPAPRYDYGIPLDVRVNPVRRKKAVARLPEQKAKLQTSIDPVKNPSWYLDDPTLRKGDIVVLKGRALVYDGGRGERSVDNFTPIQRSTLISKSERDKVERMSKGNAGATASAEPAAPVVSTAKEATLR